MDDVPPRRALALTAALLACSDGGSATIDGATTSPTPTAGTGTGTDQPSGGAATDTTSAVPTSGADATGTTGEPPAATFCPQIDVSLVVHPALNIYGPTTRAAFHEFFADLVEGTGARVRVVANVGTELMPPTDCLLPLGNPAGDPILVYGQGGQVEPGAADAFDCVLTELGDYVGTLDEGNFYFSGLLFPMLALDDWPGPGATALAVIAAASDDVQNNMYAQPGTAAEAYLRYVGDGDRRRVAALTFGDAAGRLEIFGLALSGNSRHYERSQVELYQALPDWTPLALRTCEDFDYEPPFDPDPPKGCERIDVLFAIDGSLSMDTEQDALRGTDGMPGVFAEFTDALLAELTDVEDFHVGVVSSNEGFTQLHTHSDFPAVPEGPATACDVPPGQRHIVAPAPGFADAFACIAATDDDLNEEVTVYNLAEALHDPVNAGFLRDDSLLFAVILTDEDTDDAHLARMVDIRGRILEAVDGDLSRVVVLAIAGGMGTFEAPETTCKGVYGYAAPGRRIASIVRSFRERGHFQDLCEGDIPLTFVDILDDVVSACEAYEPVG